MCSVTANCLQMVQTTITGHCETSAASCWACSRHHPFVMSVACQPVCQQAVHIRVQPASLVQWCTAAAQQATAHRCSLVLCQKCCCSVQSMSANASQTQDCCRHHRRSASRLRAFRTYEGCIQQAVLEVRVPAACIHRLSKRIAVRCSS